MATNNENNAPQQPAKRPERSLTPKQELFCRKYVEIGFAVEAYKIAYDTSNMKHKTIYEKASIELKKDKIRARISELEAEYAEASKIDRVKVMEALYDITQCDPAEMYEVDSVTGKLRVKNPRQLPKRLRKAIKTIRNNRGSVSYDFNSKTEAAKTLASLAGWEAPKKVDLQGGIGIDGRKIMDFGLGDDETDK